MNIETELTTYLTNLKVGDPKKMSHILMSHYNHWENYPSDKKTVDGKSLVLHWFNHLFSNEEIEYMQNIFIRNKRNEKINQLFS